MGQDDDPIIQYRRRKGTRTLGRRESFKPMTLEKFLAENKILINMTTIDQDPLIKQVELVVRTADFHKAEDISVYRISNVSILADFMIFMNGKSRPQLRGIRDAIEGAIEDKFNMTCVCEGRPESGWVVMDYGKLMWKTPFRCKIYSIDHR